MVSWCRLRGKYKERGAGLEKGGGKFNIRGAAKFKYRGGVAKFKCKGGPAQVKYKGGPAKFKYRGGVTKIKYKGGAAKFKYKVPLFVRNDMFLFGDS